MLTGIPEYRIPRSIISHEMSILEKLGVNIKLGINIGKDITFEDIYENYYATLIAVGRQIGRIDTSADTQISQHT